MVYHVRTWKDENDEWHVIENDSNLPIKDESDNSDKIMKLLFDVKKDLSHYRSIEKIKAKQRMKLSPGRGRKGSVWEEVL